MTKPAAFLFDMDGLLLDTERLFLQSFLKLTGQIGIPSTVAEPFFMTLVGTSSKTTSIRLAELLPNGVDPRAFETKWRDMHAQNVSKGAPLKPYVKDVLGSLADQQARMAVVTSTYGEPARHHLQHAGIFEYFEQVKAGDEVSANKPDPAPYREAAEALGVDPNDCVAFEDSDLGTQAAVAAGCLTYQIPDLRPAGKALPDLGQKVRPNLRAALIDLGLIAETTV